MKNRKFTYVTIGIIGVLVFLSLKVITDYRERNLDDVISYKPPYFFAFGFTENINQLQEDKGYEWFTKDKEPIDELMEFLSQYRVKKISEEKFNEIRNSKIDFEFTITHLKEDPAIVMSYGNSVHVVVGNYYEVVNGPIDMEWIRNYHEKYNAFYE